MANSTFSYKINFSVGELEKVYNNINKVIGSTGIKVSESINTLLDSAGKKIEKLNKIKGSSVSGDDYKLAESDFKELQRLLKKVNTELFNSKEEWTKETFSGYTKQIEEARKTLEVEQKKLIEQEKKLNELRSYTNESGQITDVYKDKVFKNTVDSQNFAAPLKKDKDNNINFVLSNQKYSIKTYQDYMKVLDELKARENDPETGTKTKNRIKLIRTELEKIKFDFNKNSINKEITAANNELTKTSDIIKEITNLINELIKKQNAHGQRLRKRFDIPEGTDFTDDQENFSFLDEKGNNATKITTEGMNIQDAINAERNDVNKQIADQKAREKAEKERIKNVEKEKKAAADAEKKRVQEQKEQQRAKEKEERDLNTALKESKKVTEKLANEEDKRNKKLYETNQLNDVLLEKENKKDSFFRKATKQVLAYGTAIGLLKRAYKVTVSTIRDMDKALTGMAVVTTMSRKDTWKLVGSLQDLATETGKTTAEIANMATKFYQQGKSTTQVLQLTEAAAKAASIAGIDGSRSVDLLTNALNGFQMSASSAMVVSDKFAALAASAATDYEELAIALSKVAAQANLAGLSMDFTLGLLTKGIEVTREAPETIGTALKTVLSRMRELTDYGKTLEDGMDVNRVATALSNIGVELMDETGQFRDMEAVITDIGKKWDYLNKNQQANVAVALAGTRQQSRLIAMMQGFERTQELVNISANSYGATLAQQAKYMGGLEAATNKLTTAWQGLITNFTDSTALIWLVDSISSIVDAADVFLNTLHGAIPILTIIGTMLFSNFVTKQAELQLQKAERKIELQKILEEKQLHLQRLKAKKDEAKEDRIKDLQDQATRQKKLIDEKKSLLNKLEENLLDAQNNNNKKKQEEYSKKIIKTNSELKALESDHIRTETELNGLKEIDLSIARDELDIQEIMMEQYKGISGILGTIIGSWNLIKAIQVKTTALSKLDEKIEKKKGKEIDKNTGKMEVQAAVEKKNATFSLAGAIAKKGGLVGIIIAAGLLGLGIAAFAISQKNKNKNKDEEELKQLQVELYNLQQSANNVTKLGDEFLKLSNKIYKSNEELKRMQEIVQQINDEAGKQVVDPLADVATQQKQIGIHKILQEDKVNKKIKDIENSMRDNIINSNITTRDKINRSLTLFKYMLNKMNLMNFNTNSDEWYYPIDGSIKNYIKTMGIAGEGSLKTLINNNVNSFNNIKDNNLRENLQDAIINNIVDYWDEEKKQFDWDKINEIFSKDLISQLNKIFESGSLDNVKNFLDKDEIPKDLLIKEIPLFTAIEKFNKEGIDIKFLSNFGIKPKDLNLLTEATGGVEKLNEAIIAYNDSENKNKESFINSVYETAVQSAIDFKNNKENQRIYQDSLTKKAELEKKLLKETDKEKKESLATEIQDLDTWINDYENKIEEGVLKIEELTDVIYGVKSTGEVVDNITKVGSAIERVSKITDITNLSLKEQIDLLKDYPDILESLQEGEFTNKSSYDLFKDEYNNQFTQIDDSIKGLIQKNALRGVGVVTGFGTKDFKQKMLDNQAAWIDEYMKEKGVSYEFALAEFQKALDENDSVISFGVIKEYLQKNGIVGLMDKKQLENLKNAISPLHQINSLIAEYDKQLERLDKNSKEYNETLAKRNEELKKNIQLSKEAKEKEQQKAKDRYNELSPQEKEAIKYANGVLSLDDEKLDKLSKDSQARVKAYFIDLLGSKEEWEKIDNEIWEDGKNLTQSLIDQQQKVTDENIKQLEKRKAAYEKYFNDIDSMSDYEERRESLLKQIESLTGGVDENSKQKIKELRQELNDLNKEELKAEKEKQREAILSSIDEEIEKQNKTMETLTDSINTLTKAIIEGNQDLVIAAFNKAGIAEEERKKMLGYSKGGLVTETGPVMVHGTTQKPEAFLNSTDTANIRSLMDLLELNRKFSAIDFEKLNNTEEKINIEQILIQPQELKNDQDWVSAGNILAQEFLNATQKRGININVKR